MVLMGRTHFTRDLYLQVCQAILKAMMSNNETLYTIAVETVQPQANLLQNRPLHSIGIYSSTIHGISMVHNSRPPVPILS